MTPITNVPVLRHDDNPHELLILICRVCRTRDQKTRAELSADGWVFAEAREVFEYSTANGWELCPQCSGHAYEWEDLY